MWKHAACVGTLLDKDHERSDEKVGSSGTINLDFSKKVQGLYNFFN